MATAIDTLHIYLVCTIPWDASIGKRLQDCQSATVVSGLSWATGLLLALSALIAARPTADVSKCCCLAAAASAARALASLSCAVSFLHKFESFQSA